MLSFGQFKPVISDQPKGFTYIEILVVMTIIVVIFSATFISLNDFEGSNKKQTYNNDLERIQALIVKARSYAKANRFDDDWGIKRLSNEQGQCGSSSTVNCFVLFKGKDFSTRDSSYDEYITYGTSLLRYNYENDEDEIYFRKITGWGGGFNNASSSDDVAFSFYSSDGTFNCEIRVGVMGVVYNNCEN